MFDFGITVKPLYNTYQIPKLVSSCSCLCPISWRQVLSQNEDVVGAGTIGTKVLLRGACLERLACTHEGDMSIDSFSQTISRPIQNYISIFCTALLRWGLWRSVSRLVQFSWGQAEKIWIWCFRFPNFTTFRHIRFHVSLHIPYKHSFVWFSFYWSILVSIYICIYMYVCIYIHICIHTYIHTYIYDLCIHCIIYWWFSARL